MRLVIDNITPDKTHHLIQLARQLNASVEVIDSTEEDEDAVFGKALDTCKEDEIASKEELQIFLDSLGE